MIKIGLTGGIGCGKSTISSFFREIGISIIDADIISREVLELYPEILMKIRSAFGEVVIFEDGTLNRRALGEIIFGDIGKKKELEDIIIPYILKEIDIRVEKESINGESAVIIDAPTLMENNMQGDMDYTIVVWVDPETQVKRIRERDSLEEEKIMDRIRSQMSIEDKKKRADFVVDNSGNVDDTLEQVKRIFQEIMEMEKK